MTEPVTLHNLYYLIDTRAWLDQRTGTHQPAPSSQLQDFVRSEVFDDYRPSMDVAARMRLWCAAHGYPVGDATVIEHDDACLTTPVRIVLATTTGIPRQTLALISIDGASPEVYADITTDDGYWLSATTVQISCPAGHGWTWDGDHYLHAADGTETSVSQLFGGTTSVISACRDCAAFDDGAAEQMCPCSGYAVYCPVCDRRCQVALPDIPVFEEHS